MSTQAFVTFMAGATLGLASLPVLVSAHDGGRHHEHDHDDESNDELSEDSPSQPPSALDVTPDHQPQLFPWPPNHLKNCTWRTDVWNTEGGGPMAFCELDEVPVGTGTHRDMSWPDPRHIVVLGFADFKPEADGGFDGEALSSLHPDIHGEPPPDNRLAINYVTMTHDRGIAKHHIEDGVARDQTNVVLCCEVGP